jgi:lysophospholipid acyltransferase (LPLAT)-like uncharacterized protein
VERDDTEVDVKIRHPAIIKWVGFLGAIVIRLWIGTLAFRYRCLGPNVFPERGVSQNFLYAVWHENLLVPCREFARRDILVLISQHADGEMIAQVCERLGFGTVRGSSTRGGLKALREMMRASASNHIAVMPDGPRGPRRHVELGLIYLAAKTGLPIVLLGIGHDRPWRLNSWDRFCIPRPFSRALVLASAPIVIPENATKSELEAHRQHVEASLNALTDRAEQLASCAPDFRVQ